MKCALVKDSTDQVLRLGCDPKWESSPPPGCSVEELESETRPDAEYDNDPQDQEGKLIVGDFSILRVDAKALRRFTNAEIDAGILSKLKLHVAGKINARTDELLQDGFEYPPSSGKFFPLDVQTQIRAFGCDYCRNMPEFSYPVVWNTANDYYRVELSTPEQVRAFFLTGMATLRAKIDSGTTLKDQIRAATTAAEVLAIDDPR